MYKFQDKKLKKKHTKRIYREIFFLPILIIVPENESIWKDKRYAPRRKPNTGPKAAILYIQPKGKKLKFQMYYLSMQIFV